MRILGVILLVTALAVTAVCVNRSTRTPSPGVASAPAPPELPALAPVPQPALAGTPPSGERDAVPIEEVTPPAPEGSEPPEVEPVRSGPEYWEELYADASYGQIIDAKRGLQFALHDMTKDYYAREFEQGRYELSFPEPNAEGGYEVPYTDGELSNVRFLPTGEMQVVRLPKEGFEEAYAMREHILWLMDYAGQAEKQRR